jgi:uncharacterized membrane protein
MTPSEGNIETSFTFLIHYFDANDDTPKIIQVVIDEIPRNLKLRPGENISNGIYYYNTTLVEGTHIYYFTASDGLDITRTKDYTTTKIEKVKENSKEQTFWYWLIWIIVIVVIIITLMFVYLYKKRRATKIPVFKAELMKVVPKHMALPGELSGGEITEPPLAPQKMISEQLPAYAPMETKYQLPKSTLSKTQRLELLEERFLRGEVDLETYKELKTKIKAQGDEDITRVVDLEKDISINEQQQLGVVEEPTLEDISQKNTSELVDKSPQEITIKPEITVSQPTTETQQPEELSTEKETEEKNSN